MLRDHRLTLASDDVELTVDLGRGADVISLIDRRTGIDVLFRTPWAERAEAVTRSGSLLWHESSAAAWLESYAGGWQLLCPNAGGPTRRAGITHGFHGEAAVVPWTLVGNDATSARLHVKLHTTPLAIDRTLSLAGPVVAVHDVVRNLSPVAVEFDYQHHPAFGAPLLAPGAVIETGARTFATEAGSQTWPAEPAVDCVPPADEPRALLGWLTDFDEPWVSLRNPDVDLGVAVRWDVEVMPHAWLWQELHATSDYPWFRRAYATAIEPSNTPAGGSGRTSLLLAADGALEARISLTVCGGRRPIRSVDAEGSVRA
jgi:hypothetical protein